jgi:putative transposase
LVEKKDWTSGLSVQEKRAMIDVNHPKLSIVRQCELINLSRASYYRRTEDDICSETPENLALMRLIDEEYTRHPFYGSRKMRDYLYRLGYEVNRKRVQRLMRLMGLASIAPKPYTSKKNKAHAVYPYLLRDLEINQANQVWCTDITYVRMQGGFVYLVAIMDWYSRKVLAWEVSNSMDDEFCLSALERALRQYGTPEIFNTDQGSQFTSQDFTDILKASGIQISMDGKGRWVDNVFIERLWRSVKYEDIYLKEYRSVLALRNGLNEYFEFYNDERPHQTFGKYTPSEVYAGLLYTVAA